MPTKRAGKKRKIARALSWLLFLFVLVWGPRGETEAEESERREFGSGIFGHWVQDENGLPAYQYTMRFHDPHCQWDPKVFPPTRLQWHQLGNDRINANAYNLGFVKLFYGESNALWVNEFAPEKEEHGGGFGFLISGDTVLVDRDDVVPEAASWERVFGLGYFLKRLTLPELGFERRVFAPVGDFPFLVSEVTLTNLSSAEKKLELIEYWDVHINLLAQFLITGRARDRLREGKVRVVVSSDRSLIYLQPPRVFGPHGGFPEKPTVVDPELPEIFLASLEGPPKTWITDCQQLFDRDQPVTDPHLLRQAGKASFPSQFTNTSSACVALSQEIILPPKQSQTLRFIYGYAKGQSPEKIVEQARASKDQLWPRTRKYWQENAPQLTLPADAFLGRELAWDYYYFTSATLYHAYYQKHHLPQGANYLYVSGGNGATRDYAAFVQTLSYYRPELAREVLEFMMRSQETSGRLFYDLEGYGMRYRVPYRPGDLDLWFLMALVEYVFATRDFAFLDQVVPYYPLHQKAEGTVWEHARKSFEHLVKEVGVGRHGHPRLRLSDWNDEMMWLTAGSNPVEMIATFSAGESVMNTALACYVMPLFHDLARLRKDETTATAVESYLEKMRSALQSAWHEDHLLRAYSGFGQPFGDKEIYLEPQVFALLAENALTPEQEQKLLGVINSRLRQPSALGMMISTSTSGSLTTRPGEQEEGGIWFAINGPGVVAFSRFDPVLAWEELKKNTLAWHAEVYPETWFGIWSGPDAWNSVFSDRPAETWYMKTPVLNTGPQMYPVQNAHAHCQTMWGLARLAGVTPTAEGWTIIPRIPMRAYSFDCALYSLEVSPNRIRGEVKLPSATEFQLKIQVPPQWSAESISVQLNHQNTAFSFQDHKVGIMIPCPGQSRPVSWEVFVKEN